MNIQGTVCRGPCSAWRWRTGARLLQVCFFNDASYTERLKALQQNSVTISEETVTWDWISTRLWLPLANLIKLVLFFCFKCEYALHLSFPAATLALSQFYLIIFTLLDLFFKIGFYLDFQIFATHTFPPTKQYSNKLKSKRDPQEEHTYTHTQIKKQTKNIDKLAQPPLLGWVWMNG